MADGVFIVPITDENRDDLKWLTVAQMLYGRSCCYCGFTWASRADVEARAPIVASVGAETLACAPCWNTRALDIVESGE